MNRHSILRASKVLVLPTIFSLAFVWLFVQGVQAQANPNSSIAALSPSISETQAQPVLPSTANPGQQAQPSSPRILSQDDQGLVLEFEAAAPRFEAGQSDMGTCQNVLLEGFDLQTEPGAPRVPMGGAWIGVPPAGDVAIQVLEQEQIDLPGNFSLCPAPQPALDPLEDPLAGTGELETLPNPQIYQLDAPYPSETVALTTLGFLRSQRAAALRFAPIQFNPVSGELKFTRRLRLKISFDTPGALNSQTAVDEGDYENLLRTTLLNYEYARSWRSQPLSRQVQKVSPQAFTGELAPQSQSAYKVIIDHDAVYTLTYTSLQSAGLPVDDIDPRTFRIENQGSEIAIEVAGEQDASFDAGDVILFYGQAPASKWTNDNVYWLTWGGVDGLRIQSRDAAPSGAFTVPSAFTDTLRVEKNNSYNPLYLSGPEQERWYWSYLTGYVSGSKVFSVTRSLSFLLHDPAVDPGNAMLRIRMYGTMGMPNHHTVFTINNQLAGDLFWPNIGSFEQNIPFSQTALISGTNYLTVHLPVDSGILYDYFWLNWFEIVSQRQYKAVGDSLLFNASPGDWEVQVQNFSTPAVDLLDISDPRSPVRLTGALTTPESGGYQLRFDSSQAGERRYYAFGPAGRSAPKSISADTPSDLHSTSHGADYILISHKDFLSAIQPLAALRASEGLRVAVVDVQDIYDEFSYGLQDPNAIHDFLAYGYANWQPPAPLYVQLVGDGHYDLKNYLTTAVNFIPPFLQDVDRFALKETSADNRFVTVAGDDLLPDMHLGRFPVRTAVQASAVVNKLLTYAQPASGDWVYKTTFVADNPDSGGNFPYYSDLIADNDLPAIYWKEKLYSDGSKTSNDAVRAALLASIKEGRLLISYVGHGGTTYWYPYLWDADAGAMTNAGKYPFFVPMTCLEGYFLHHRDNSLAESFLYVSNRGSIGSFSPTGLGLASGHDRLERGLFKAFFENHVDEFGPATTQAKLYMMAVTGNGFQDLVDTYVLIGDPAARLPLAALPDLDLDKTGRKIFPPAGGLQAEYVLTITNNGTSAAQGVVLSDTIPFELENPVIVASTHPYTQLSSQPLRLQLQDIPTGAFTVITMTADVLADYVGAIENTAAVTGTNERTWSAQDNRASDQLTIIPPDLKIEKQGEITFIDYPDYWLSYVITYTNQGDYHAANVLLTDTLPAGVQDISTSHSGMPAVQRSQTPLAFDIGDTPPGLGGVITITARFPDDGTSQSLLNQVVITSTSEPVDLISNNEAQASNVLPRPDLAVSKVGAFLEDFNFPKLVSYHIHFVNNGTLSASQVLISDTLPTGLTDISTITSGITITQVSANPLQFEVLDLPVGGSGEITVTANIMPLGDLALNNAVEISSPGEIDLTNSDNRSESVLEIWRYLFGVIARQN